MKTFVTHIASKDQEHDKLERKVEKAESFVRWIKKRDVSSNSVYSKRAVEKCIMQRLQTLQNGNISLMILKHIEDLG